VTLIVFPVVLGLLCDQTCLSYHPQQNVKKIEPSHQCFLCGLESGGQGFEPAGSGTPTAPSRTVLTPMMPCGRADKRRKGFASAFRQILLVRNRGAQRVIVSESHGASGTDIDSANSSKPIRATNPHLGL
jgi:hypothetical protein